jgi:hypothetical protein
VILVDDLRWYPIQHRSYYRMKERWAHMVSDASLDELHAFAARVGLRRAWFQGDHYDLRPRLYAHALRLGAVQVDRRELAKRRVGAVTR